MTYLADYEVNRGRQPEIDCLKALVIIIMIFLHVFEGCTERNSVTYYILTYLECLTGAGTFMLCMGIGARYSRHQTPKDYLRRGFELLTVGQALNLVRDSLPYLIIWWINGDSAYLSNALLIIQADILSFAGFAFMLLALLKRMRFSDGAIVLTGIIMNAFAYVLFHYFHTTGNFLVDQLLAYFIVTDAEAYFPLCSYFVYVAFGYALGRIYLRIRNKDALSVRVLLLCGPIAIGYYLLRAFVPISVLPEFNSIEMYIMKPGPDALANILMSVFLLAVFHILLRHKESPMLVNHLSGHINQYYCLSFILLVPMCILLVGVIGERMKGNIMPMLYSLIVLTACYFIISWVDKRKLPNSIIKLKSPWNVVAIRTVWLLTFAIVAYVYPRITEYATIWNNYLDY